MKESIDTVKTQYDCKRNKTNPYSHDMKKK